MRRAVIHKFERVAVISITDATRRFMQQESARLLEPRNERRRRTSAPHRLSRADAKGDALTIARRNGGISSRVTT